MDPPCPVPSPQRVFQSGTMTGWLKYVCQAMVAALRTLHKKGCGSEYRAISLHGPSRCSLRCQHRLTSPGVAVVLIPTRVLCFIWIDIRDRGDRSGNGPAQGDMSGLRPQSCTQLLLYKDPNALYKNSNPPPPAFSVIITMISCIFSAEQCTVAKRQTTGTKLN